MGYTCDKVKVLMGAPKLRHVDNMGFDESGPLNDMELLPRCRELVHLDISWSICPDFLPSNFFFCLPAFKSLTVTCHELTLCQSGQNVRQLFADLAGFQHRSATALSSLTLRNFQVDGQLFAEELTATLSLLPEIKVLCVDRFRSSVDPLLQALTYTKDHHNLLPNLTTLLD
ncbi:hypothetical protein BT96DRAFT_1008912 [Gymnopus androsaceus JB14]|uniref:RNI-like protein n=1 Tax=Gymnopus androsaceus JB14 TaxID=1447944 RepID=A0A6A4GE04_9AGAR|nr:hypothetical protein BT96DRAFT_1008912 [Gymnopus androsaceus JB14]